MCGINGIWNFDGKPVSISKLKKMNSLLNHRGPDESGEYIDGGVGLGHQRLSIIDVNGGSQPMMTSDKSLVIVYNGEVYNYRDLKNELFNLGYNFETNSDTEVVLKCYQEFGNNFVEKLRGMFAICIWDKENKQIVLARDRLGQKPIYYFADNSKLIFSSELDSLLSSLNNNCEVDPDGLNNYLNLDYIPAPFSIYKSIRKIPSSNFLICKDKTVTIQKYWDMNKPHIRSEYSGVDPKSIIKEMKLLLNESVRMRMISDVPIGAFLSGGIDSSGIVAIMAKNTSKQVKTFSIGLENNKNSELKYARMVSNIYNTHHTEFIVDVDDFKSLPNIVKMFNEPLSDRSSINNYYVSKLASDEVKVALSGDGGDEVFAGYPWYKFIIKNRNYHSYSRYSKLFSYFYKVWPNNLRGKNKLDLLRQANFKKKYSSFRRRFPDHTKKSFFKKDFLNFLESNSGRDILSEFCENLECDDLLSFMLHVDANTYLADKINTKVDRMSMQNSIEVRSPLLDHKLVEFAYNIPSHFKIKDNLEKYVLKEVLKDYLPTEILDRPKQGFGLPSNKHTKKELDNLCKFSLEILCDEQSRNRGMLNINKIEKLLVDHSNRLTDPTVSFNQIWNLLNLEIWFQVNRTSITF
tara:strand:+ start:1297 stop:3195 length:1899 start_codon:yes stop_codon:yes gene_type:complete